MRTHPSTTQAAVARRSIAVATAALALATLGMVARADRAEAFQCPPGTVQLGILCIRNAPTTAPPAPTTTTTAPPVVALPPVTVPPVVAPPAAPAVSVADGARRLMDLANAERAKAGLGALAWRDDVAAIALAHSERMAAAGDIFHSDTFFGATVKNLLNVVARGENVAYNGSIENAHSRLMASSGHRANILDPRFSVVGIGVVRHADGRYFITQDFIQPAGAPRSVAPRPAATTAPRAAAPKPAAPKPAPAPAAPATVATAVAPAPTTTEVPAPVVPADAATLSLAGAAPEVFTAVPASASAKVSPALAAAAALLVVALMAIACWLIPRQFRS